MSSPGRNYAPNDRKRRRLLEPDDSDEEDHEHEILDRTASSNLEEGEEHEFLDSTATSKADGEDLSARADSMLNAFLHDAVGEVEENESLNITTSSDLHMHDADESNDLLEDAHHNTCQELIDSVQIYQQLPHSQCTDIMSENGASELHDNVESLSSQPALESYRGERSNNASSGSHCGSAEVLNLEEKVDSSLYLNNLSPNETSLIIGSEDNVVVVSQPDMRVEETQNQDSLDRTVVSESSCLLMDELNVRIDSILEKADKILHDEDHTSSHSGGTSEGEEEKEVVASELSIISEKQELITAAEVQLELNEPNGDVLLHSVLNQSAASNESCDNVHNISFFYKNILEKELRDMAISAAGTIPANCTLSAADNSSVNFNNTVHTLLEDEPTFYCGALPHAASTPSKVAVSSISLPRLNALQALVADIAPIEQDESLHHNLSETDDTDNEEDSAEDGSDSNSECNSDLDICGETDMVSDSVLEKAMENQQADEDSNDNTSDNEELECPFSKAFLLNNVKIYPGNVLTVNDAILELMDLYLRNKLTKAGVSRTLQFMCKYLPDSHNLLTSSHAIFDYIQSLAPPMSATAHYYCAQCCYYHGVTIVGLCEICQVETKFNYFYYLDLASLIKYFFEVRNLASIIDSEAEKKVTDGALRNLRDGSVYKSINVNRNKYDVNLIVNTDGVKIRRGGKKELWPIIFTVEEAPIHLQKSFLTVCGIWYDLKKPNMKTFLKPFVQSMESLHYTGVEWIHPTTKEVHKSRVFLPVTVLDAPARAAVQNLILFNGKYGCNICEIKLQLSAPVPDKKNLRIYNYVHNPILRTKERMLHQASEALAGNLKYVKGVKGPSVLTTIPSVDESKCIVPEYLHSVLLGVVKQVVSIWTVGCLKQRLAVIDSVLKSFKHPDFVHRAVRQLESLKGWKASDFYYFLLFEALPALEDHLPEKYFQHFMLLVKGIFSLLKSIITESEVKAAELLLKLFVVEFGQLYGDRSLTHNIHQLLHLGLCVRRYGPLFCFSAFPFEDLNGLISKSTHGTNNIEMEIVNNIRICQGIQVLRNIVRGQHDLHAPKTTCSSGELLGKDVKPTSLSLSAEEINILNDDTAKFFSRAKIGYDVYTSEIYKSLNSQDFFIMWKDTAERKKFGTIRYFAHSNGENFIVIRLFAVDNTRVFYHKATRKCIEHFVPVNTTNTYIAIRVCDIAPTIVKVGRIKSYIYLRPHLYRFVM